MRPVRTTFAFILFFGSVFGSAVAQEEPLVIAGAAIPKVFEPGIGKGPYVAFFDEVVESAPIRLELLMLPVKRLARSFFDKQVQCIYMATDDDTFYQTNGVNLDTILMSRPFNRIFMRAYSRTGEKPASAIDALNGMLIAGDNGIHVSTIAQRRLPFAKRILYTKTVDEAFEILASGRVDITVAYSIDAESYFERSGRSSDYAVDTTFSLLTLGEGVACWPSIQAETLISYLDKEVAHLSKSGRLERRYGFEVE